MEEEASYLVIMVTGVARMECRDGKTQSKACGNLFILKEINLYLSERAWVQYVHRSNLAGNSAITFHNKTSID